MAPSKNWASLWLAAALAGCGAPDGDRTVPTDAGLEAAARARGLTTDPGDAPLTGLFARGNDRICIVGQDAFARIGVSSDYGDGIACAATGIVTAGRGKLAVTLGSRADCRFDAQYDGVRIVFPARLPSACQRFCSPRASLSALSVERLSDSAAEAGALRDMRKRLLCAS